MSDQIVPREERLVAFKKSIMSQKAMAAITNALPGHLNAQKMARVVITAVTRTPKLLECTPETVMNAVLEASQLGLMPDGVLGHGYILPYGSTAVFIPGYKGLLDLARRSGEIAWIQARIVYANDDFHYQFGMDPKLDHIPARATGKDPGKRIAAYGVAKFKSGEVHFEVMHEDEIETIRARSRAKDDGPWVTDRDEMSRKTVIRRLCKYLPMNPEYQSLVTRDEYHDAGVLGQYIEVDPETGEVTDPATASSMLDMFTDELESEPEIEDPRFEESDVPEDVPSEEPAVVEPEAPAEPEAAPDPEPPDDELVQGSGRISKQEDAAFLKAIEKMRERMLKVQPTELVEKVFNNRLGVFGAEQPEEIRARSEREKFYRERLQMCEQWESMNKRPEDDD